MADIFISYSSEDREQAHRIADALESEGWQVWWDRTMLPGTDFDETKKLKEWWRSFLANIL